MMSLPHFDMWFGAVVLWNVLQIEVLKVSQVPKRKQLDDVITIAQEIGTAQGHAGSNMKSWPSNDAPVYEQMAI